MSIDLYNGDCYELLKSMPDKCVDLVIIDPPYQFVSGGKGHSEIAERKHKLNEKINSLDTQYTKNVQNAKKEYIESYIINGKNFETEGKRIKYNSSRKTNNIKALSNGIRNELLYELQRIMKATNIYIWCNKEQLRTYFQFYDDLECNVDLLTWHKTNPIPTCNNTYLPDTEYLFFAREKGVKVYGQYDTKQKWYISSANVEDKKKWLHPTIKPLNIIENLVINSSKENDVVLDCFMGSGTTGVACKKLNRNFIGIELNDEYFNIAKARIENDEMVKTEFEKFEDDQLSLF